MLDFLKKHLELKQNYAIIIMLLKAIKKSKKINLFGDVLCLIFLKEKRRKALLKK